jgi:tetratricopeptide (TPR) repeat protein
MQEDNISIAAEKDKLTNAKDKLQADAVSYLAVNAKLQKEKDELDDKLRKAQRIIENKVADLQRSNKKLEEMENETIKEKNSLNEKLVNEKKDLQDKLASLEVTLQKEKAQYYYNLGVAYAKAKLYDEAIGAYEKSLKIEDNNVDAHYNVGLLYDNLQQDPEKAIFHFQKYLELKPDADDKDEVKEWINRLKQ